MRPALRARTRGFSITYNGISPNISAREAMVRLLHHGVTIPAASSKGYFSENFGSGSIVDIASDGLTDNLKSGVPLGGAGVWTNAYAVNLPGLGPQHIAGSILNNLNGVAPTQTLINMVNTNTIDLTDTLVAAWVAEIDQHTVMHLRYHHSHGNRSARRSALDSGKKISLPHGHARAF
jgi:hypothetical protein